MNIIVCCKFSPDAADILVRDGAIVPLAGAEWSLNAFDLQALETAVQLVEAHGGKVTALSAGPAAANVSRLKKDLLSRGADELVMLVDERLKNADTALTATVLAAAIQKIGAVDLVLFGEGSADMYFQQTGVQVGQRLGFATLNAVGKVEVDGAGLLVERSLEEEVLVLECPLPAALSVTTDISQPRLPSMKEILKAGKKPVQEWSLNDLDLPAGLPDPASQVVTVRQPQQKERQQVHIQGPAGTAAQQLLDALAHEGFVAERS